MAERKLVELQDTLSHYEARLLAEDRQRLQQQVDDLRNDVPPATLEKIEAAMMAMHGNLLRAVEGAQSTRPVIVRDQPRLPTEIVTHWIAGLTQALANTPAGDPFHKDVDGMLRTAKSHWLKHALNVNATATLLESAASFLTARPRSELGRLAVRLAEEVARYDGKEPPSTRLFDNIYGRAFETALAAHLVENPPPAVMLAMRTVSEALATWLESQPRNARFETGMQNLQTLLCAEDRFWRPAFEQTHPQLEILAPAPTHPLAAKAPPAIDAGRAGRLLIEMLQQPVANGIDCIAIAWLTAKIMNAMGDADVYAPGKTDADSNYMYMVNVSGRRDPLGSDVQKGPGKWVPAGTTSGIMLAYQPKVASGPPSSRPSIQPALRNEPRFSPEERDPAISGNTHRQTPATMQQLQQGIPFVSGVSGTTNLLVHFVAAINERAATADNVNPENDIAPSPIDFNHAMLGTLMFLVYDGGHSLHEALWTLNQTDSVLRELADPVKATGRPFVGDYEAYFASLGPETSNTLQEASDKAFGAVINLRNKYVSDDAMRA